MKFRSKLLAFLLIFSASICLAQTTITAREGYTPQIGILVDMIDNSRDQILESIKELKPEDLDYQFDEQANTIGALLMHLIATESYYMVESLEERSWNEEEQAFWGKASHVEKNSQGALRGHKVAYYLKIWNEVHDKTLSELKKRDDNWLNESIDEGINNHYIWFHVLDHQANHFGQISLIKGRLPE